MQSVAEHLPEAQRLVYCVDTAGETPPENFEKISVAALGTPRFLQRAFALPAVGLCCWAKPHVMLDGLARTKADALIYVDNDIVFYRRPRELLEAISTAEIVLTPHLTSPLPPTARPTEAVIRPFGTWNAGIITVRAGATAIAALNWWGEKLDDPQNLRANTGWDQCWLDFMPALFPNVAGLRHEGYNVASWNLATRPLEMTSSGWRAGNAPLCAFHFSWFDPSNPERFLRPGADCNLMPNAALIELGRDYASRLLDARHEGDATDYAFSHYQDGAPIEPHQRALVAAAWARIVPGDNPFAPNWCLPGSREILRDMRPHSSGAAAKLREIVRRFGART